MCNEPGHCHTACPNQPRCGLLLDEVQGDKDVVYDSKADDNGTTDNIHNTHGDKGLMLVSWCVYLAPRSQDTQWLCTNIFKSTCTIHGRICTFIIDSGSNSNVILDEAFCKLDLPIIKYPAPYSLTWLHDGVDVQVTRRALVPFSIEPYYKNVLIVILLQWMSAT